MENYKSGFVGIFGKPNAGKSTLLNAILKEKLAIVTPKAQTTRNKILGILTEKTHQIIFSDTPGILKSNYKLHERMMSEVMQVKQGTDVSLFVMDANDNIEENVELLKTIAGKSAVIIVINKIDKVESHKIEKIKKTFSEVKNVSCCVEISALKEINIEHLLQTIVTLLPLNPPYYDQDTLTDKPMRFFVSEIIREKLFLELDEELPYHCAVIVRQFLEKNTLTNIVVDIVVSRETQKAIIIGKGGSMIAKIGLLSRTEIEKFIERKVFLELKVKVRKDWRNNPLYLNEYGY